MNFNTEGDEITEVERNKEILLNSHRSHRPYCLIKNIFKFTMRAMSTVRCLGVANYIVIS